jgi:chitodextrinase
MRRRTTIVAACSAALLAAGGAGFVLAAHQASAATAFGVAPYVDLSANSSGMLDSAITQAGLRSYTAAFVIGSGCTPIWGDSLDINSSTANAKIAKAQSEGATTIISFGGAGGVELAQSCTDTAALTAAYQSVITKYGVNHLDFDVEGAAIADPASVNRRFQAIKTLEANNSGLNVSVTIPVLQSGPDGNGSAFLQAAKNNGTRIDLVNIMTMDYGGPVSDMGAAAISAANGTMSVARGIFPGFGFGNLGITPMIGQNDQAGEIFTEANASAVVSFANSNGVGRLAFWSVGRDQPCPGGAGGGASPNCSSISQNALDFTRIFLGGTGGGGGGGGTPTPTPTGGGGGGGGSCTAPAWNPATAYNGGAVVSYNGHQYTAKWWTQGDQPDLNLGDGKPWADNGACSGGGGGGGGGGGTPTPTPTGGGGTPTPTPTGTGHFPAWQAGHAYAVGDRVSYAGHDYQCLQAHTSLTGWEPPNVPALWQALN